MEQKEEIRCGCLGHLSLLPIFPGSFPFPPPLPAGVTPVQPRELLQAGLAKVSWENELYLKWFFLLPLTVSLEGSSLEFWMILAFLEVSEEGPISLLPFCAGTQRLEGLACPSCSFSPRENGFLELCKHSL